MPWTQLGPAGEPEPVIAYKVQVGDEVLTVHPSDVTIVRLGPPADRGDTIQPDPAMIERAVEEAEAALDLFFSEPEKASTTRMIAEIAVEAAAGVIVPATAEPPKLLPVESMAVTVARAMIQRGENPEINMTTMLLMTIERLTAAGLSAAATGGDGDE